MTIAHREIALQKFENSRLHPEKIACPKTTEIKVESVLPGIIVPIMSSSYI